MAFTLRPAHQEDLPEMIKVQFAAFVNEPFHALMNPGDPKDPKTLQAAVDRTLQQWREHPTLRVVKCVEDATGRIVGFASGMIITPMESKTQLSDGCDVDEPRTSGDAKMEKIHEQIWMAGETHIYFRTMCILPTYQRHGVGTQIALWGLKECKKTSLPAYITSSAVARGLYERLGFQWVGDIITPASEFGGEPGSVNVIAAMVYGVPESKLMELRKRVSDSLVVESQ